MYKKNITKKKIPKISEKTSDPRKPKKERNIPRKRLKTSDISLVSRDIGNTEHQIMLTRRGIP